MRSLIYTSLFALIAVPASANTDAEPEYQFGDAVRHNILVQSVPVNLEDKMNTFIPADPARQSLAIQKYEEDKVEERVKATTTDVGK